MRVREAQVPELGDKFCSRYGQEGTIGLLLDEQDMPRTKDGIVPDLIINPHAIPSRMTIGQLLECVLGKEGCETGTIKEITPFSKISSEDICNILQENSNFEKHGNEILYNGISIEDTEHLVRVMKKFEEI